MEDCRPLICGICFILQETADDFVELFTLFHNVTSKIEGARPFPESIITDQQKSMISALMKLQTDEEFPRFCHLLDQFHILKNASPFLNGFDEDGRSITKIFKQMMYTKSGK
jgi:hypothetical protein